MPLARAEKVFPADPATDADRLRVTVSVLGRFHAFDLARELHRAGALDRLITSYPKFFAARWDLPQEKVASLLGLELLSRTLAMIPKSVCRESRARLALCRRFDERSRRCLPRASNLFVGWSSYSLRTLRAARKAGMKTVVDRGGSHIDFQTDILAEEYRRWGERFTGNPAELCERERQEYDEADRVAVPSRYVKRTFIEQGIAPEKLLHLPYGVSLQEFFPTPKADDVFRVIYCGALSLQKGLPYLLQAFHELNLPGAELWLVGPVKREVRPILARYCGDKILLKGVHPQGRLRWFYSQCSVFCLASVDDGFGMVIPQAMACGLPIIHTTNTGGRDIVDEGVEGFEVPIRDVAALKDRIRYLYEQPQVRQEMGHRARARAAESLSWQQYGDRAIAAYRGLLGEN